MGTREETLLRVREKYPQYKDIPDDDLANALISKYPQYKEALSAPAAHVSTTGTDSPATDRGGLDKPVSREEAKRIAQERMVARDPGRLIMLNKGQADQNVGVKGQGAIPRALAATVGGGFTSGPARIIQDLLLRAKLTTPEAVDALGVNRVSEENPGTTLAGNLAGGIIPAGKVFQGASALSRIGKAGVLGSGYGASESIKEGGIDRLVNDKAKIGKDAIVTGALSTILPGALELPGLAQHIIRGKISPEAGKLAQTAKEMDIPITPAQATGSRQLGLTEKALLNVPVSSGIMQARQEAVSEGLRSQAKKLLDDNGPRVSEQTFGDLVQTRLAAREGRFKGTASKLYDKFEKAVPKDLKIQLGRARDLAENFIEREINKEGLGSSRLVSQLKTFVGEADPTGKAIPKATDVRTFLDIRAAVNDEINSAIKNERGDVARKLGMIKAEMDKSLSDFAQLQGGKIQESFSLANGYYAKGAQIFNDPKVQRMIQKDPGMLYDMIAQPGTVKDINTLKAALGVNRFEPVKRAVMEKILTTDGTEAFSPQKFGTSLGKFTPENIEAVFGASKVKEIQDFWKVADAIVKNEKRVGNPSGTAQQTISVLYGGSIGALAFHNPAAAGAVVLGPPALAKLYTSQAGLKFLTEAIQTPANSPNAAQLASKISAILSEEKARRDMSPIERDLILKKAIVIDVEKKAAE